MVQMSYLPELREMGVGVYATGGETADVGDLVRTIIVDSTVTYRMKRSDVIDIRVIGKANQLINTAQPNASRSASSRGNPKVPAPNPEFPEKEIAVRGAGHSRSKKVIKTANKACLRNSIFALFSSQKRCLSRAHGRFF